jgi:hypothetical protein
LRAFVLAAMLPKLWADGFHDEQSTSPSSPCLTTVALGATVLFPISGSTGAACAGKISASPGVFGKLRTDCRNTPAYNDNGTVCLARVVWQVGEPLTTRFRQRGCHAAVFGQISASRDMPKLYNCEIKTPCGIRSYLALPNRQPRIAARGTNFACRRSRFPTLFTMCPRIVTQ